MFTTKGSVKTDKAAKYLVQLCKHFAKSNNVNLDNTGWLSRWEASNGSR